MNAPRLRKHESGLRTQEVTGPDVGILQVHRVPLPEVCPISHNPREGSTLTVMYRPGGWCLEVYSLPQVIARFRGGWKGTERYPAERNMEGMIALLARMVADAVGVRVGVRADLVLDAGRMRIRGRAEP